MRKSNIQAAIEAFAGARKKQPMPDSFSISDEALIEADNAYEGKPYDPKPIRESIEAVLANPKRGFGEIIWAMYSTKYVDWEGQAD